MPGEERGAIGECIPGSVDNRHDFSIVPVEVSASTTLVFKICRFCGISYRYVDQTWEEIWTEGQER
ncbi:MAG: hypothetical protein QF357_06115 [Dehalococcoidia bacterium]|jgi:hypothetical protein|nr:hypothetical protein [Dehalococcoidia bacterium]